MSTRVLCMVLFLILFAAGIVLFDRSYPKVDCNDEFAAKLRKMSELERTHFLNQNKFRCI
jgi:uncharacterized Fe-S cluster-containing protein